MATLQIGTLPPRDVEDFLATLRSALDGLDDLAQLQATVGTLGMQVRAQKTEDTCARLLRYVEMLEWQQREVNR